MQRGRKKKTAEVEILPPEDDPSKSSRSKVVEAKHTIEFKAPHTIEEPINTGEDEDIDLDDDFVSEDKPKKKRQSYREELRKKLRAQGVSPTTRLTVTIEKYVHSESVESGMWADREFCTKSFCEEEYILSEGYMDLLRQWGPGTYRITLRLNGTIVDAFDKRVAAPPKASPIIQNVNPADPNSPQVIVQSDGQQAVIPSIKDIMKVQREALKEQLEMAKLMREAYGFAPEQSQQQPRSEDEILAGAILKQPEIIENVVGNVIKRFGGRGGDDDGPWYADIVRKAVESGQAAEIVRTAIDSMFNGFRGLFPGGQNGQAPMAETPLQNQTQPVAGDQQGQLVSSQEVGQAATPDSSSGNVAGDVQGSGNTSMASPEEHALARLIDNCRRGVPAQVAFDQLIAYADRLNDEAPQYSIDSYISMFAAMPVDEALTFVKTQPNGEQVVALPHAKEWTTALQQLIREAGQEGDGE